MLAATADSLVLELVTPGYELVSSPAGPAYRRLLAPGPDWSTEAAPGEVRLPVRSVLVALPPGKEAVVRVLTDEASAPRAGIRLEPAPFEEPLADPLTGEPIGTRQVYPTDRTAAVKPYRPVSLGETGYLRDWRFVRLTLRPFEYRPDGTLVLHRRLRVAVDFVGDSTGSDIAPRPDPYFEPLLHRAFINAGQMALWLPSKASIVPGASPSTTPPATAAQRLRIHTPAEGIYIVTYTDIAATGVNVAKIVPRTFRLESGGSIRPLTEHALFVFGEDDGRFDPGDYLLFFGQGADSRYTREQVYWLSWGGAPGLRMEARSVTPGAGGTSVSEHQQTSHFEENVTYLSSLPATGVADRWYWDRYQVGGRNPIPRLSYTVSLSRPLPGQTAGLRVAVRGFTSYFEVNPDHSLQFFINDVLVGTGRWDGQALFDGRFAFPSEILRDGENVFSLFAPNDTGASTDVGYLDFFAITYPRRLTAVDDRIAFAAPNGGRHFYEVDGFGADTIEAFDVGDPARPVRLLDGETGSGRYRFSDDATDISRYWVQTTAQRRRPSRIAPDFLSHYRSPANQADYLIISHADFLTAVAPLAQHRQNQGYRVLVVDVEDVYDEFGDGLATPEAIRAFVDYAYHHWQAPAPAFLLLVGDGTYDPLDFKQSGRRNTIPPLLELVDPFLRETATDNRLVTVSGDDILPDLFVGRLPVNSPAEATAVVNKIIQYETAPWPGDWRLRNLFVADNADTAGDFPVLSDQVADAFLPGLYDEYKQKIYLGVNYSSPVSARGAVLQAFNEGVFLSNYTGHGQVGHWASEFLFRSEDAAGLVNGRRLPVHLSMTCLDGRFHEVASDALTEVLIRHPAGGAVAAWAATGLGVAHGHDHLHRGFYRALYQDGEQRLGALTLAGKLALFTGDSLGVFHDLIDTFVLLGDPALRLELVPTDLALTLEEAPTRPLGMGEALVLRYRLRNLGPMPAPDAVVRLNLPPLEALTATSEAGPLVIRPGQPAEVVVGTLPADADIRLTIRGVIPDALADNLFTVTAEARSGWRDADPANNASSAIRVEIVPADEDEPNDEPAIATPLTVPGRRERRSYHTAGDQDWFVFTAQAGVRYRFMTDHLSAGGDTLLVLLDAFGNELAHNDDIGPGVPWSALTWTAPTDGSFYLLVTRPDGGPIPFYYDLVLERVFDHFLPLLWREWNAVRPTPTPTSTPTPTPTPSATPTATPTSTPTPTPPPTVTPTPTATPLPPGVCLPIPYTVLPLPGAPKALIAAENRVLAGLFDSDAVAVIDGNTQDILGAHSSGGTLPNGLAVGSGRYFVSHRQDGIVSVFDLGSQTPVARFTAGALPWGLALAPDGLYVANFGDDTVTIHDPATGVLRNTAYVPGKPSFVLPFNAGVWVTRQEGATGLVVITAGGVIVTPVAGIPAGARHLALDARTGLLYVGHPGERKVYVVDTNLRKLSTVFDLPAAPYALAVNTVNEQLYAVGAETNMLYVLDLRRGTLIGQVPVGHQTVAHGGQGLAYLNGMLYVANDADRTVTVLEADTCRRQTGYSP